ncbi:hypothetical protein HYPSUDRAFT_33579, partial [Hypholoma sublateritium FD-334 SS-4]
MSLVDLSTFSLAEICASMLGVCPIFLVIHISLCLNPSVPDCHTVFKVQIIYIIAATLVSVIGFAITAWIIIRQRRTVWRRKQELGQVFIPPRPNPSDPPYDPSIGRPVQNVGPGAPQPQ